MNDTKQELQLRREELIRELRANRDLIDKAEREDELQNHTALTYDSLLVWAIKEYKSTMPTECDGEHGHTSGVRETVLTTDTPETILQHALLSIYRRMYINNDKFDLVDEVIHFITHGVEHPVRNMDCDAAIKQILLRVSENYRIDTIEQFVEEFVT